MSDGWRISLIRATAQRSARKAPGPGPSLSSHNAQFFKKRRWKRKHLTRTALQGLLLLKGKFTQNNRIKMFSFSCLCERDWDRQKYEAVSGGPCTRAFEMTFLPPHTKEAVTTWLLVELQGVWWLNSLLFFWGGDWLLRRILLPMDEIDPNDDRRHFRKEELWDVHYTKLRAIASFMLTSNYQSSLFPALTWTMWREEEGVGAVLGWGRLLSEALITDENLRHSGIKYIPFSRYGN